MTDKSSSFSTTKKRSPNLSITTRVAISFISAITDLTRRNDGTINRRLLSMFDPLTSPNPTPSRGVSSSDVTVDPTRNLWFRLFLPTPAGGSKIPVIVFFHGGGFALLSAASRTYDVVCRRFARKLSAAVVSVNYRLAPEHKYPAPYEDGLDVLRYLDSDPPPDLAAVADLSDCFLMGDSAGGNIAHHVAKRYAEAKDWKRVRLSGLVIIQPYFGGEERTEAELRLTRAPLVNLERTDWLWRSFLPEGADRDHEAANVFGPRDKGAELGEGFPKAVMVVVGGWDPLQDWQRRYVEGLRMRGKEVKLVEYEDAVHAFYVFPGVEEGKLLIEEVKEFMERNRNGRIDGVKSE